MSGSIPFPDGYCSKKIGLVLKFLRTKSNIKQADLGVNQKLISNIEVGNTNISLFQLMWLLKAYDVSTDIFFKLVSGFTNYEDLVNQFQVETTKASILNAFKENVLPMVTTEITTIKKSKATAPKQRVSNGPDLSTIISSNILKLYDGKFKPIGWSASKISKVLNANVAHNFELIGPGLIEMGVDINQHKENIKIASKFINDEYTVREFDDSVFTVADFAIILFNDKKHKSFQTLISKLNLATH